VQLRNTVRQNQFSYGIHFGPIASGDEDIVDPLRAQELRSETSALCVAWEGSGGARAACFNEIRFVEIRCITDGADPDASVSFHENCIKVMPHAAELLTAWRNVNRTTEL
jgi:adenosylhomocysteine nucleosidase